MFTTDSLDDNIQTRMINVKRMSALGLVTPEYLARVADEYRAYLKEKFGILVTRRSAITHAETFMA